ncbi:MAG: hypothetical protein H0U54_13205 [Acidobacteria bacterium]|nr:hypothetical protein [Acidobacteriota bacterium]
MTDSSDSALQQPQTDSTIVAPIAELSDESSDLALVNDARTGDEAAFEELFNRHRRRVSLIASRFFRQREQMEEVV